MQMIEIVALENGAHNNQTFHGVLPEGWAVIPPKMEPLESFPFGEVEAEEIGGVMTVTKWTPGVIPEEPEPVVPEPTSEERLSALEETTAQQGEILNILLNGETGDDE